MSIVFFLFCRAIPTTTIISQELPFFNEGWTFFLYDYKCKKFVNFDVLRVDKSQMFGLLVGALLYGFFTLWSAKSEENPRAAGSIWRLPVSGGQKTSKHGAYALQIRDLSAYARLLVRGLLPLKPWKGRRNNERKYQENTECSGASDTGGIRLLTAEIYTQRL